MPEIAFSMMYNCPEYAPNLSEFFEIDPNLLMDDPDEAINHALGQAKKFLEEWGLRHGIKVAVKRSKTYPQRVVYLGCSRGGKPRRSLQDRDQRASEKIDCPFSAELRYLRERGAWTVMSYTPAHNHGPALPETPTVSRDSGHKPKRLRGVGRVDLEGGAYINYHMRD